MPVFAPGGEDWQACHSTKSLRVDMRMYFPGVMDCERLPLEEWPGSHDSHFVRDDFQHGAHLSPSTLRDRFVDELYQWLFVVLTDLSYFDSSYTYEGSVAASPPPDNFIPRAIHFRPLGTLTTLRIALPTNSNELHDRIPLLVGL
ncbi:hypothetical protein M422DRAFT_266320 [Sphaerobolus stellatus SS14]|uniref:Uncharacterized protein n=1 Tax=Sphaerobolus stellatus (strain SS14) TaxID=990650 RepID=A0A0C9V363_SPHS4|nr:hypothetical protein M422DRAFT_266320 [Sphaerobolus stellatus SS14]